MSSRRAVMIGFVLAAILLIQVGVAQAAPASQGRQTAAIPVVSAPFSHSLYGKAAGSQVAAGSTRHGCPYGYACMYTTSGWKNNTPEHEYYYYGCYALYNEYGTRVIYNNQYGGGDISGFGLYCGSGVLWTVTPGGSFATDITPDDWVELYH